MKGQLVYELVKLCLTYVESKLFEKMFYDLRFETRQLFDNPEPNTSKDTE